MAIAYAGERFSGNVAGTTSLTITLASSCSAGSRVVLGVGGRATGTPSIGVTDSRSNTWAADAGPVREAGNAYGCILSTAQNGGTLVSSDTLTVTITGGSPTLAMAWVQEISGVASSALDQTSTNTSSVSNQTADTGTSGTTAQANELVVNFFYMDDNVFSPTLGSGYSQFTTLRCNNGGKSAVGQYKIVSATGTQTGSITWTDLSQGWVGLLATYKEAATALPPLPVYVDSAVARASSW